MWYVFCMIVFVAGYCFVSTLYALKKEIQESNQAESVLQPTKKGEQD